VVAEGSGNLAQERVKTRLLNLSCITKKGDAIIDQPIKGWVVDADGRAGLSGHVVAKFGSHVARVAIAGFLEGFGKALELSVTETTTNVFGTQSSQLEDTSGETLLKAGAGRSVVNVAKDLQKFYLQLAQQTMPVIEVGPTKNITVVISEGEELVIKERKKYAQKD
jgi:conjugal transfer pilus assembly protein TraB